MTRISDARLTELLNTDPLHEAEKVTGKSYKEDEATAWGGMALAIQNNAAKKDALLARGDTTNSHDLVEYIKIIESYGFECVYSEPFRKRDVAESFFVYWHPDGLLLSFDTFRRDDGAVVNGGRVTFYWRPNDGEDGHWDVPSMSRSTTLDGVVAGALDCREALIFHLEQLRRHGSFVTPWPEPNWLLSLHHHGDNIKSSDPDFLERWRQCTADRYEKLPEHVRVVIGPLQSH